MTVKQVSIDQDGVRGTLFYHEGAESSPGVILISGSEGGIPEYIAQRFVRPGCVVFALAYFGVPGLPPDLERIPLEYFVKAISVFGLRPEVDKDRIGLIGNSRGAELVLLLASKIDLKLKGICALVPSVFVNGGFPRPNQPAWTLSSDPIAPYLGGASNQEPSLTEKEDLERACSLGMIPHHEGSERDPYLISDLFKKRENAAVNLEALEIPVENISCPLLLIAGQDDQIWPSAHYLTRIRSRFQREKAHKNVEYVTYEGAGHGVAFPYFREFDKPIFHPFAEFWCTAGGSPEHNEKASVGTQNRAREFFEKYLN
jgi:dienelactone hydrolase